MGIDNRVLRWTIGRTPVKGFNFNVKKAAVRIASSADSIARRSVHGRIYQTIDDMRAAIGSFLARYNAEWLIEKNGLRSPCEARATWNQALMKVAA
jgi:hypothetical protein